MLTLTILLEANKTFVTARVVLLVFALAQWMLAWWVRFLPKQYFTSALKNQIVKALAAVAFSASAIAEVVLYRSLSGQDNLRDDNFFFVAIIMQALVGLFILFKSGSILKKKVIP